MTNLLYNAFVELTGTRPAWGMLTGIHPVKLLRQYVEEQGEEAGVAYFQSHCHVTAPKAELARRVLRAQAPAVEALTENDFSLYVSIPFCPTRCACGKIRQVFDLSRCTEFTVEAGRPDTITGEKLLALREAGISRISINPQSLSDQVLRNIGRRHTAQDIVEAFQLAQRLGFDNINADLIVGLPGDDLPGFQKSLEGVLALGASNVTVHSLALKLSLIHI